ncbi:MAG: response regulator [Planctomycetota bacterium]|nr:MAG: response regulator [Planctomycetota bacterium]
MVVLAEGSVSARIALVEDSEVVRRFALRLLRSKGFEVSEHPDGAHALEHVLADPPDLVISDIQMPRLDGLELTRKLRETFDKRRLPIILVSVLSEEEDIVSGFEAGANDYLVKPYRTSELLAKISILLRERDFLRKADEPAPPPPTARTARSEGDEGLADDDTRPQIKAAASPRYFFDKYVVTREFGRGGMGTVYKAIRREDDLPVALKILAPRLSENRTAIARFLRECRVLAGLHSEHVVRVLDHGYDAGRYFLVMEAVEGDSLDRIVLRDGPLGQVEAAEVFAQVARALQDLSDQGLVHRDVKPANIIRRHEDGKVKLVDFGLAKRVNEASSLTDTGYALGTSYYVAPEVIEGAKADERSDLFAVGVSLFEVVTGRRPFSGVVPYQIFKRIVSGPTPDPTEFRADLSPGLVAVINRLLARDLSERYACGAEVEQDLRAWLESEEAKALRENQEEPTRAFGRPADPGVSTEEAGAEAAAGFDEAEP